MEKHEDIVSPCVGCGYCCITSPCLAGIRYFVSKKGKEIKDFIKGCPGLKWNDKRYICELTLLPDEKGEEFRKELCIGAGCSSDLNNWRKNVKKRN